MSVLWRHIDGMRQEPDDIANQGPFFGDFGTIESFDYFDLTGRFNVMENVTVLLTVSNLLDRKPPIVGASAGSTAFNSGNTYPSTYDALGRRYALQVGLRF